MGSSFLKNKYCPESDLNHRIEENNYAEEEWPKRLKRKFQTYADLLISICLWLQYWQHPCIIEYLYWVEFDFVSWIVWTLLLLLIGVDPLLTLSRSSTWSAMQLWVWILLCSGQLKCNVWFVLQYYLLIARVSLEVHLLQLSLCIFNSSNSLQLCEI